MLPQKENYNLTSLDISELIETHYSTLMQAFYQSQSGFLCSIYKRYQSIESANIILCFSRNVHLEIIRQREKDLNFDVSIDNFWKNFSLVQKPEEKIMSIVKITGIPKETVRRKIKNLMDKGFLSRGANNKGYYWSLSQKEKDAYFKTVDIETKNLTLFISKIVNILNIKIDPKKIEQEIRSQFSFYWYHYLSCQLEWLKWWQLKLKDNDLLLIALQATIPTLQFFDGSTKKIDLENVFKIMGKVKKNQEKKNYSISATSIAQITGITRTTTIRKLDKLVNLGFLIRETSNKRYSVNQSTDARTKNILSKENVAFSVQTFSEYIAIILNSLMHNKL